MDYPVTVLDVSVEGQYRGEEESRKESRLEK
jgi:hypothetical protein